MSLTSKVAIGFSILAYFAIAVGSNAETPESAVVKFLPDDVLPQRVLSDLLVARHVGDYRVVEVDTDALRQLIRDASASPTETDPPSISLPLVDQSPISIELNDANESHQGWQTGIASFHGQVAGDEMSTVICMIAPDGSMNLVIRTAGRRYKLEKSPLLPYHIYWVRGEGFSRKID